MIEKQTDKYSIFLRLGIRLLSWLPYTLHYKIKAAPDLKSTAVIAFWHQYMLAGWFINRKIQNSTALISRSKDGDILASIVEHWGIKQIRGSSSDKGSKVLQMMIESIHDDNTILITPDGPRGPAKFPKPGAVLGAQRSGKSLILCRIQYSLAYMFKKSWDQFLLPLPFTTVYIEYSQPLFIPLECDQQEIDNTLQYVQEFLNGQICMD
jgi:lysophospholipid acyltransferase (LPLAT)-like uncharacterized protein